LRAECALASARRGRTDRSRRPGAVHSRIFTLIEGLARICYHRMLADAAVEAAADVENHRPKRLRAGSCTIQEARNVHPQRHCFTRRSEVPETPARSDERRCGSSYSRGSVDGVSTGWARSGESAQEHSGSSGQLIQQTHLIRFRCRGDRIENAQRLVETTCMDALPQTPSGELDEVAATSTIQCLHP